jgi:hypothetical protein
MLDNIKKAAHIIKPYVKISFKAENTRLEDVFYMLIVFIQFLATTI